MIRAGIPIGLGNDGYIFDVFENMCAAYLLHKVHLGGSESLNAARSR